MKTYVLVGLLACIVTTGWVSTPATLGQEGGVHVRAPFVGVDIAPFWRPWRRPFIAGPELRMSQILGTPVENPEGQLLGTVNDVTIGDFSGRVLYVTLLPEDNPQIGNDLVMVPWYALRFQPGENGRENRFVLDADKETLRDFPRMQPEGHAENGHQTPAESHPETLHSN